MCASIIVQELLTHGEATRDHLLAAQSPFAFSQNEHIRLQVSLGGGLAGRAEKRRTFGPHGKDDVSAEALAGADLVGDLERDLDGHQVRALAGAPVVLPGVRRAQEVLVFDVHEALRLADGTHVGVLDGEVHNLALGCTETSVSLLARGVSLRGQS